MRRAFCVIGDLVRSRDIRDRRRFQSRMQEGLEELSRGRPDIVSPYTVTLGDEFQAVYSRAQRLFGDLLIIQGLLYPARARFGIGIGAITTPINRASAIGMDGPAFVAARDTLNELKKESCAYRIRGLDPTTEKGMNLALDLVSHIVTPWKANRLAIVKHRLEGKEPREIARVLGLSDSAVYKNIREGALSSVLGMLGHVGQRLDAPTRSPR